MITVELLGIPPSISESRFGIPVDTLPSTVKLFYRPTNVKDIKLILIEGNPIK